MPIATLPGATQEALTALIEQRLAPHTQAIDEGLYPTDFLHALGDLGGFRAALPEAAGGLGLGLPAQAEIIAQVAQTCGTTAFLVWCQAACAWYLSKSGNAAARERYLQSVASGVLLAGTGMSNTVKHLAGIERINLRARPTTDGYAVDGALPWVSNLAPGHLLVVAAQLEDDDYLMFATATDAPGVTLRRCPTFAGLEGSGTLGVHFKAEQVASADLLAGPQDFANYVAAIKPGFLLLQAAMGVGLVRASIDTAEKSNRRLAHVNQYLDDQAGALRDELNAMEAEVARLARLDEAAPLLDLLRTRARGSELALRATQSAALHAGANGYLQRSPAQRRQREALFVAIVTPALKQLRKEIHGLQQDVVAA